MISGSPSRFIHGPHAPERQPAGAPIEGANEPQDRGSPCDPALAEAARQLWLFRRERRRIFNDAAFANPGWDILLDVYLASADGERLSTKSACLAATVPKSTALRYLARLCELQLVTRVPHPSDNRTKWIELTAEGLEQMEMYLARTAILRGQEPAPGVIAPPAVRLSAGNSR
jgi:DNA-binding MarR family transcriptional regulator